MAAKKVAPKAVGSGDSPEPEQFTWKPEDGGDPIVLPASKSAVPKGRYLWFMRQLRKQNSIDKQVEFVLAQAGVPEAVQDRIFELGDTQMLKLVEEWSGLVVGATPGES